MTGETHDGPAGRPLSPDERTHILRRVGNIRSLLSPEALRARTADGKWDVAGLLDHIRNVLFADVERAARRIVSADRGSPTISQGVKDAAGEGR
jgi:hypothetical protein